MLTALLLILAFRMGLPRHDQELLVASESTHAAHDPIYIIGNAAFNSTNGVVRGDGTQDDPYVIDGWEVNASNAGFAGLMVWYTDAYFVVEDMWIHSGGHLTEGIDLSNCEHAILSRNTIEGNGGGVGVYQCRDVIVSDNTLRQNGCAGIWIGECENTSVYSNYVFDNSVGVDIWHGHNVTVTRNNISSNDHGINATNDPTEGLPVLVWNNNIWWNTEQAHMFEDYIVWPVGRVCWNAAYPQGGNFWSGYGGSDQYSGLHQDVLGSDGIGDTEYRFGMDFWGEPGYYDYDCFPLVGPLPLDFAPIAAFTVNPAIGDALTVFEFNASHSSDAEDSLSELTFRWDWDWNGIWDTDWSSESVAHHNYDTAGNYTVRLEVMDSNGLTNNTTQQVRVLEAIPEFSASVVSAMTLLIFLVMTRRRLRPTTS
jgi:parallel beta-helix repeat protein